MNDLITFFNETNLILVASGLYLIMSALMLTAYSLSYALFFRVLPMILGCSLLLLALKQGGIV